MICFTFTSKPFDLPGQDTSIQGFEVAAEHSTESYSLSAQEQPSSPMWCWQILLHESTGGATLASSVLPALQIA